MTAGDLRILLEGLEDEAAVVVCVNGKHIKPWGWALEMVEGSVRAVLDIEVPS